MPVAETEPKRQDTTRPGVLGGITSGLVGRMRVALGGRDHRAEVEGYRLALRGAGPSQAGVIVDRLLELAEADAASDALTLVAGAFDRIESAKGERALIAGHGRWGKACTGAAIDVDAEVRLSAATLIGRACEPETFGALRELLGDRDERVAERAGESLIALAERAVRAPKLDGEAMGAVERLVVRTVREFDRHKRREPMSALLALCSSPAAMRGAGTELKDWLADSEHPAHMIVRGMIRRGDAMATRSVAWLWLGQPGQRGACVERLSANCDAAGHETVLVRAHLLHNPARAGALAGASERDRKRKTTGLMIDGEMVEKLSPAAQAGCASWIECTEGARAPESLETLLTAPGEAARMNALRSAARLGSDLTLDFCVDSDARIARSAALAAGTPGLRTLLGSERVRRTLGSLARSGSGAVRDAAGSMADALDPLADRNAGIATARRMLRGDRAGFIAMLQTRVRNGASAESVRSMRLAQRLGLGAELELELLSIVAHSAQAGLKPSNDESHRLLHGAATAVTVLAELSSPAAQHAVHKCLHHPDDRVRANALDALARAARRSGTIHADRSPLGRAVVEFNNDPHHRVRAGAARARLMVDRRSPGPDGLGVVIVPLLTDARAMHRVSGLWLAERTAGLAGNAGPAESVAAAIAEIVRTDPEPEVRIRARVAAGRLLSGMRGD